MTIAVIDWYIVFYAVSAICRAYNGGDYYSLFVYGFRLTREFFYSYRAVTIAGEGLQIFIYARHSKSLSSEGSLACHTYCDTGHPFILVISENPWYSHLLPRFSSGAVTTWFNDLMNVCRGPDTQQSACGANALALCAPATVDYCCVLFCET